MALHSGGVSCSSFGFPVSLMSWRCWGTMFSFHGPGSATRSEAFVPDLDWRGSYDPWWIVDSISRHENTCLGKNGLMD